MYDKNVAIIGPTIEKTTNYDHFREDKIRMELYQTVLTLYAQGYRTFTCHLNTYIGLLAADTVVMLREAGKCPDILLGAVIPETPYPAGAGKLHRALYADLMKQADTKRALSEKQSFLKALECGYVLCYYDASCPEMKQVGELGKPFSNIKEKI